MNVFLSCAYVLLAQQGLIRGFGGTQSRSNICEYIYSISIHNIFTVGSKSRARGSLKAITKEILFAIFSP